MAITAAIGIVAPLVLVVVAAIVGDGCAECRPARVATRR